MNMNILLVEPDVALVKIYGQALETAGHQVCVATDAQQAIDLIDEAVPDVVFLELQLVGHSGIEFLYELRSYAEWQKLPVIILSNVAPGEFTGSQNIFRRQLGINKYLYKPQASLEKILATINELEFA